jgi:hypothetical protein
MARAVGIVNRGLLVVAIATGLAGCDQDLQTVGPEGGFVSSPDGRLTLDIPKGALDQDVVITIEAVDDAPAGALGQAYEIEPRYLQLSIPATLTYDVVAPTPEGAESLDISGAAMEDLTLVTEKASDWDRLADLEVDADAGTVSATVVFFSAYAVVPR